METKRTSTLAGLLLTGMALLAQPNPERTFRTPMVHDPVMAQENDTFYLFSTGHGIQQMTSADLENWKWHRGGMLTEIPEWTRDSVPGFKSHIWAPDVIRWHNRWWMMYSCSTFGKNTSAIGLLSSPSLANPEWKDLGCVVTSHGKENTAVHAYTNYNAIDPNIIIDENDQPWLSFGSFWDGIQLVQLDSTMHIAPECRPQTIARRYGEKHTDLVNPTSKFAGTNAIEAPFIFRHNGWYYLFVSWDYCCRGEKSSYNVVVGRSRNVQGPYLDREGRDMAKGGGTLVIEGDKKVFEAAGHCSVYNLQKEDKTLFLCHGYSIEHGGQSILVKRFIDWTDGWPRLE